MDNFDIAIIGAGASGLFAGALIGKERKTIIVEKNSTAGKKLLLTGAGKCNFTNMDNRSKFLKAFGEKGPFLKFALKAFDNQSCIEYFKRKGLEVSITEEGKVYPKSQNASDIRDIFLNDIRFNEHFLLKNSKMLDVYKRKNEFIIETEDNQISANNVILCTGGKAYPETGSTGDGYKIASKLGHSIVSPVPALTPLMIKSHSLKKYSGVTLYRKTVSLDRKGNKAHKETGDILITHNGFSGPAILNISKYIKAGDKIRINLSNMDVGQTDKRIIDLSNKYPKKSIKNIIKLLDIPESISSYLCDSNNISTRKKASQLTKEKRKEICRNICELSFVVKKKYGFEKAMITSGGISLDEVNPKSMESLLVKGLYFAGEILDIDGKTGGYNLQAAFSTAFLASRNVTV
jgi:hypothetical protein